jgi:diadenosine tetraphosphate (Ap4A) HIT family hydrolase
MIGEEIGDTYILKETDNFVAMPSIGALMPGYLLVLPRQHLLSFGHIPATHDAELQVLLQTMERWLMATYSASVIFFEHGPTSFTKRGGSCTDHAHLHLAPVPSHVDLLSVMRGDFAVRQVQTMAALHDQIATGIPYLFLRHHDGTMHLCHAPDAKSQHLRRALARQLGLHSTWDWAAFPGAEHILATIQAFAGHQDDRYSARDVNLGDHSVQAAMP